MTRHTRIRHAAIVAALALGSAPACVHAATPQPGPALEAGNVQTIDTTSLDTTSLATTSLATTSLAGTRATSLGLPSGATATSALVMQARAEVLRPAPVPDQDFDAPGPSRQSLAAQQQASIQPGLYSAPRQSFSGDGFSPGSTLADDHANRHRPGGVMSLSIPVP